MRVLLFLLFILINGCRFSSMTGVDFPKYIGNNNSVYAVPNPVVDIHVDDLVFISENVNVKELFESGYAYYGNNIGVRPNLSSRIYVFNDIKSRGLVVESGGFPGTSDTVSVSSMYNNRRFVPTYVETNNSGTVLGLSYRPIFYRITYDYLMDNDFDFFTQGNLDKNYIKDLSPAGYYLKAENSKGNDVGSPISNAIGVDALSMNIENLIWHNVTNWASDYYTSLSYRFLSNHKLEESVSVGDPLVLNNEKGWNIWKFDSVGSNSEYYLYVYTAVEIGVRRDSNGEIEYLYFFRYGKRKGYGGYVGDNDILGKFVRLSTKYEE